MTARPWPTREEWAADYNTVYADHLNAILNAIPRQIEIYATPAQTVTAADELDRLWATLGRRLIAGNKQVSALFPEYEQRFTPAVQQAYDALPKSTRTLMEDVEHLQVLRRRCRDIARDLRSGRLPEPFMVGLLHREDTPELDAIMSGYWARSKRATDEYVTRIETRAPDDAAWQKELDRRARIENARAERMVYKPCAEPPAN